MTTGELFILFVPFFTQFSLSLLSKIVCSLWHMYDVQHTCLHERADTRVSLMLVWNDGRITREKIGPHCVLVKQAYWNGIIWFYQLS